MIDEKSDNIYRFYTLYNMVHWRNFTGWTKNICLRCINCTIAHQLAKKLSMVLLFSDSKSIFEQSFEYRSKFSNKFLQSNGNEPSLLLYSSLDGLKSHDKWIFFITTKRELLFVELGIPETLHLNYGFRHLQRLSSSTTIHVMRPTKKHVTKGEAWIRRKPVALYYSYSSKQTGILAVLGIPLKPLLNSF